MVASQIRQVGRGQRIPAIAPRRARASEEAMIEFGVGAFEQQGGLAEPGQDAARRSWRRRDRAGRRLRCGEIVVDQRAGVDAGERRIGCAQVPQPAETVERARHSDWAGSSKGGHCVFTIRRRRRNSRRRCRRRGWRRPSLMSCGAIRSWSGVCASAADRAGASGGRTPHAGRRPAWQLRTFAPSGVPSQPLRLAPCPPLVAAGAEPVTMA